MVNIDGICDDTVWLKDECCVGVGVSPVLGNVVELNNGLSHIVFIGLHDHDVSLNSHDF